MKEKIGHPPGTAAALVPQPIPGSSSVRRLEEDLEVANIELDEEARRQIAAARA
jgi:aryl-alcohol dehydrogenase-like predicted oxidoreductase